MIQVRDMATFFATTLLTLRQLRKDGDTEHHTDNRVKMKQNILNLEALMSHTLPFNHFKEFLNTSKQEYLPYLNLYCLIQLYQNKLEVVYSHLARLKNDHFGIKPQEYSMPFNSKYTGDPEFLLMQIMVGKSMINILEFIKENQKDFNGVKIRGFQ